MNEKINNVEQICSVKRMRYVTGRAKDLEVMIVHNGKLCFELIVDKCLDIHSFYHKGTSVAFISANGLNVSETEFSSVFNGGLLYTCGLDTIGGRVEPIHGRVHNIPAEICKVEVDSDGIEIVGNIKMTSLFGEKLQIVRTIKTAANSDSVEIKDELTNFGYLDAEYSLLYHTNFGYPFIDEGVTISAPITSTEPRTEYARARIKDCFVMEEPKKDNEETVFYHTVEKGEVTITNEKLKKMAKVEYDEKVLPHFIEWKSMVSGAYALGVEPATSTLDDAYLPQKIKPNETVKMGIKITVCDL